MPLSTDATIKNIPPINAEPIARAILGARYNVTLVFIGSTRAQSLNQQTRNKSYVPNVLSFPLDDTHGEVYICPEAARREAANFELSETGYLAYLFIHGCLHLKGYTHGAAMDACEATYIKKFNIT